MVTKAQLEEKIKGLEKENEVLKKEKEEIKIKCSYDKVTELQFQVSGMIFKEKNTKEYYDKLIKELENKIEKLESEENLILGRKPFDDKETIKLMYKLYLEDNSFNEIANELNNKNICTRRGGTWTKSSVSVVLKKEENIREYLTKEENIRFFMLIEHNKKNKKQ
ncbi:recombinase family protein [Clostridium tarantellae]|uniref:Recombinase domain-containing protein n=1 Tax=Clostridium tarantellae TaxID=39493 RepID=A0A6I1MP99_9CLOT|nr:recombinase family protein [Clostridium tarantellae]MPQ44613.1 hypothetical protein [Clostridium tarantellae]